MTELIYDRTRADVLGGNEKGCYGAADLNRVETAVGELLPILQAMGHDISLTVKTDWIFQEAFSAGWPIKAQMNRYLGNVKTLCSLMGVAHPNMPSSMDYLMYTGANAIEESLQMVYDRALGAQAQFNYSGEFYAGEE